MATKSAGTPHGDAGPVPVRFPESGCFGCSASNPSGLRLEFLREGARIACEPIVEARFDGAPGVIHGGIQATLLDETMCAAVAFLDGSYVLTGELSVRYRRACPSGERIRVVAWIERRHERYAEVAAEILGPDGTLRTEARGKFFYDRSRPGPGNETP